MGTKRLTPKKILALLSLVGSLIWLAVFSFPDNKLHLVFCDVGQGDATLITKGFNQILIDGGPNDKVLTCLKNNLPFWDKKIEIVTLTHPEADHMAGLISVLDKYEVEYFLAGPEGNETAGNKELIKKLEARDLIKASPCGAARRDLIKTVNPYSGKKIRLGEITLNTLWPGRDWVGERLDIGSEKLEAGNITHPTSTSSFSPPSSNFILGAKTTHSKLNDFSLVFLLEYGSKKVLFMGDADSRVQDKFIDTLIDLPIDILKFPHHGSKTGMKEDFLEKIKPKEAVISVGRNSYGHPTAEALNLLKEFDVVVRRTDLEGDITYNF